mmetsp:Transcript_84787/g.245145  ORF Transcript_84787/g.245145 Transcript_84787/m.245145 type:complete len:503 (-) Transcript_84787:74-1582(-)|eukprot:CAMPEP_0176097330 /NCGR_PEP_ID=MMETSP0120_2-20121206/48795_1 /TAXON_ID=160619 /ORGANISM="Kryptoperidinium foliaceum, Strain CCMP 1326" /LENGTH=502 /DNA_ID=CAMNT_0017431323 /DNA_START=40 /DNA_END=1548 /DNA_ORIENTATION=-
MAARVTGSVLTCHAPGDQLPTGGDDAAATRPSAASVDRSRPARVRQSSFGNDDELVDEHPPTWTLQRFQKEVSCAMKEYFVALIVNDAVARVEELLAGCPGEADELGVVAIRAAIDRDEAAQRAVVELFCALRKGSVVDSAAFVRSFEKLFCTWEDIAIDAPKAPQALLSILIGCVGGEVVNRSLLTKLPENLMTTVLSKADEAALTPEGREMLANVAAELKEFKRQATHCIDEFFVTLSATEVRSRLGEIGMKPFLHEFVKKAITTSYSHRDPEEARGHVLTLFGQLTPDGALSKDDLQLGVTRLLGQLEDLALDCPRAAELTIEIISGLVADELVSVPFLRRCRQLRMGGAEGLRVLDAAQRRTPEYCKKHLGTLEFKKELNTMILEYFNSGDEEEFGRCVRDLAPLTEERSAELIRKIMTLAMERSGKECEAALKLLVGLCRHEEIAEEALEAGFNDLYSRMPDLLLDVPDAHEMARSFVVEAKKANVLRRDWPDAAEG